MFRRTTHSLWPVMLAGILLTISLAVPVGATTYYVPTDYKTIQAAIVVAQNWDTILVRPGEYEVIAAFAGKRLIVRSTDGPLVTILRPVDQQLPIFSLVSTEPIDTEIDGFTFTGYDSMYTANPRGIIQIDNFARPRIQHCIFRDNHLVRPLNCVAAAVVIRYNLFYNNTGDFCVSLWKGSASILNNTMVDCDGGILTMAADIEVLNNNITNCKYYGIKGAIYGLDFNNVWSNGLNYSDSTAPGRNDMSVDPLYVNRAAHDYHLSAGSSLIDAGNPETVFNDPDGSRADIGCFPYAIPTGVDDPDDGLPAAFALLPNYPNPFNGATHISFTLPSAADVSLNIFNVRGQLVTTLIDSRLAAGEYNYIWDGADDRGKPVSSGIYFARLTSPGKVATRAMVYCK